MIWKTRTTHYHTHTDERGALVKCYHECRGLLTDWRFILGITISYPFEHLLWERVFPFSYIAHLLGMH